MALGLNKTSGSQNAMLASRSTDGGLSWSNPATLILDADGIAFFNDKNAITADPTDSNYVYAVWDRLASNGNGPAYFARSINGGLSWETALAQSRESLDSGAAKRAFETMLSIN